MKAIDTEVTNILNRLSGQSEDAKDAVQEIVVLETPKEEVATDKPDEIQPDGDSV
jgi:hypothetical protein